MTMSSLLRHGIDHLRVLLDDLHGWCAAREYNALGRSRGIMSRRKLQAAEGFERANYIRILQGYSGSRGRTRL
jgi:dihydroorotate dehydrogenase (fumarate)